MKRKNGFTLAEVLITLAAIGIVAALTLPSLFQNITNKKIGPAISKFSNTFTNAARLMMQDKTMNSLDDNLSADMQLMAEYIDMVAFSGVTYTFTDGANSETYKLEHSEIKKTLDKMAKDDSDVDIADLVKVQNKAASSAWKLKDGSLILTMPILEPEYLEGKGIYKRIIGEVLVDIDGNKSVNKAGVDVFGFLVDQSGTLIPAGSIEHNYIEKSADTYITSFTDTCNPKSADLNENFACTGKIANNGWSTTGLKFY